MKKQILYLMLVLTAIFATVASGELKAAPYYAGKTIKLVVGSAPGGGYDRWARLVARHMPKYIPGNPTIVIQNIPGATSIVAANYLYNIAKPNGLTFGAVQRGLPFAQLLQKKGVKFDLRKFAWIGSPIPESNVLMIRTDLPYKTVEDLQKTKTPIILGDGGMASSSYHFAILLKEFVGINAKMIHYRSSADIALAIERKEVDGKASTYGSFRSFIDRGLLRPVIRSRVSEPGIENVPVDEELTTDQTGKTLFAMRTGPDRAGRPYIAPPGLPPDIYKILSQAFKNCVNDADFRKEAEKLKLRVEYVSGEDCLKEVKVVLNQPENIVKEFAKYIQF